MKLHRTVFQFDYTLMVPAGSSIAKVADVDRSGIRIAAVLNHASTNESVGQVKHPEFVYAETPEDTFSLSRDGKADVVASTRLVLLGFSSQLAGARVLADRYGANINRMVVPKGNRRTAIRRARRHPRRDGGRPGQFRLIARGCPPTWSASRGVPAGTGMPSPARTQSERLRQDLPT